MRGAKLVGYPMCGLGGRYGLLVVTPVKSVCYLVNTLKLDLISNDSLQLYMALSQPVLNRF